MENQLHNSENYYTHEAILFKNKEDKLKALELYVQKYAVLHYEFVFAIQANAYADAVERFKPYKNVSIYNATDLAQYYAVQPELIKDVFSRHGIPAFEKSFSINRNLFVYRELADALMSKGFIKQALTLESVCSEYLVTKNAFMLCGYSQDNFICKDWKSQFEAVCKLHTKVHTTDEDEACIQYGHAKLLLTQLNCKSDPSKFTESLNIELRNNLALIRLAAQSIDGIISKPKLSEHEKTQLKRHCGHINIGLERIMEKLQKS